MTESLIKNININTEIFFKNISVYLDVINHDLWKIQSVEKLWKHIKVLWWYAFQSSNYQDSWIPIIRISDFNNEKINLNNVKFYKEDEELSKYLLKSGDIIIAMTGWTIWKLARL
jgi:hypothetical protein